MKIKILASTFLALLLLTGCEKDEDNNSDGGTQVGNSDPTSLGTWGSIASFPGASRDNSVAFSINGEGYVGLGTNYPTFYDDFYKYNPTANQWTKIADFPGVPRRSSMCFVLGGIAYVGGGYGNDGNWGTLSDFYKYDPISNQWTKLNNIGTDGATTFVLDGKAYLQIGTYLGVYDEANDTWTKKKDLPVSREDAISFTSQGKGYVCTGYNGSNRLNDVWQYSPTTDTWLQKGDYPGGYLNHATSFEIGGFGYCGTGTDFSNGISAFFRYHPSNDSWTALSSFPSKANGLVSFVIDGTAYSGLGWFGFNYKTSFYKFEL